MKRRTLLALVLLIAAVGYLVFMQLPVFWIDKSSTEFRFSDLNGGKLERAVRRTEWQLRSAPLPVLATVWREEAGRVIVVLDGLEGSKAGEACLSASRVREALGEPDFEYSIAMDFFDRLDASASVGDVYDATRMRYPLHAWFPPGTPGADPGPDGIREIMRSRPYRRSEIDRLVGLGSWLGTYQDSSDERYNAIESGTAGLLVYDVGERLRFPQEALIESYFAVVVDGDCVIGFGELATAEQFGSVR
jgi:hypothetical protein